MTQKVAAGKTGYHAGLSAEESVARAYEHLGMSIINRRWRGCGGEIDLIARDGATVVFIEVKKSRSLARAAERLSPRQMERIQCSAAEFLEGEPLGSLTQSRFDAALVDAKGEIQIVENAFGHG
ncbi:YraN family protein [Lutimaribacter marinistellae]|uniref:UPF0102 protein ACFORG_01320 n=1 Tax=Lutimaribacter marinistellae TaxID=1820329 RepID=A0ABV7TB57_9RHOB